MRRRILVLAVVPLVLTLTAQPAAAGGPPVPWDGSGVSYGCGFKVRLVTVGRVVEHYWEDADGNIHYVANAMGLKLTATNPATGKSTTVMNNGVLLYTQNADDTVWRQTVAGPWVWTADPETWLEEEGLWYSTGRISWSGWDPPTYSRSGRIIDMCPLLAS